MQFWSQHTETLTISSGRSKIDHNCPSGISGEGGTWEREGGRKIPSLGGFLVIPPPPPPPFFTAAFVRWLKGGDNYRGGYGEGISGMRRQSLALVAKPPPVLKPQFWRDRSRSWWSFFFFPPSSGVLLPIVFIILWSFLAIARPYRKHFTVLHIILFRAPLIHKFLAVDGSFPLPPSRHWGIRRRRRRRRRRVWGGRRRRGKSQ